MKITKTEQVLFRQGESTENTETVTVLKYRAKFGGMVPVSLSCLLLSVVVISD